MCLESLPRVYATRAWGSCSRSLAVALAPVTAQLTLRWEVQSCLYSPPSVEFWRAVNAWVWIALCGSYGGLCYKAALKHFSEIPSDLFLFQKHWVKIHWFLFSFSNFNSSRLLLFLRVIEKCQKCFSCTFIFIYHQTLRGFLFLSVWGCRLWEAVGDRDYGLFWNTAGISEFSQILWFSR